MLGLPAAPIAAQQAAGAPWLAPLCGEQAPISAVFDHEHPSYGCPPNGNPRCTGHNGVLRLYNDTIDNRRLYEGHNGWDFRTRDDAWRNLKRGVHAVRAGTVTYAGWHAPGEPRDPLCGVQVADHELGYGLMVRVAHEGEESLYGHLSGIDVRVGQAVARGQRLGASGDTGNSAGPHLHLGAFRPDGPGIWHAFDPYGWNADWRGLADRPLPDALDPWFVAGGPASERRLAPTVGRGPVCPSWCGEPVIVDDQDPGFDRGCGAAPCAWQTANGGLRGRLLHAPPEGTRPTHWARWRAALPPGRYGVDIYLPAWRRIPPAHAVPYYVAGRPADHPVSVIDQHAEGNVWVPLGVFDFPSAPSVELRNGSALPGNWAYTGACRAVLADAVRFTRQCEDRTMTSREEPR